MLIAAEVAPGMFRAIGVSALVVIGVLLIAFVVGRIKHRYRDIDVFWPLGFVAVAVAGFIESGSAAGADAFQRTALLVVVALWGLRLSAHLAWRSRGHGEDPRYTMILRGAGNRNEVVYALIIIYGFQALLMWFVSLSVTVGMYQIDPVRVVQGIGLGVWLIGFGFESIGDYQLSRFLSDPANAGTVMRTGLWSWTRHPNYFGDAAVWWGIFLIAAAGGWGALTILSPLVMTRLLTSVSGKPLLEGRLRKTREGYEDYVARTSGFFPRPPRSR